MHAQRKGKHLDRSPIDRKTEQAIRVALAQRRMGILKVVAPHGVGSGTVQRTIREMRVRQCEMLNQIGLRGLSDQSDPKQPVGNATAFGRNAPYPDARRLVPRSRNRTFRAVLGSRSQEQRGGPLCIAVSQRVNIEPFVQSCSAPIRGSG
jgi:hypothetical protein